MDEFDSIARLFRPLAEGSPEALSLLDDAAILPQRAGFDLVVTTDAVVEGVHFLPDDPPGLVAKKLLRVNLSDIAAKAAEPYGYLLTVAWPPAWGQDRRAAFARGLGEDQAVYALRLFGGDTVSTPGPMTASVTLFGWVPAGRMVRRGGARVGDLVLVSGTIGDGWLGLAAAEGRLDPDLAGLTQADRAWLADRYRLPRPRVELREALIAHASAGADVSDGLLADAGHIAEASGVGVEIDLDRIPLSPAAAGSRHRIQDLASGGDDYEILCTAPPDRAEALTAAAARAGTPLTICGRITQGRGVAATLGGRPAVVDRLGWRHG